jgi:hypothetical protein
MTGRPDANSRSFCSTRIYGCFNAFGQHPIDVLEHYRQLELQRQGFGSIDLSVWMELQLLEKARQDGLDRSRDENCTQEIRRKKAMILAILEDRNKAPILVARRKKK